MLHIVSERFRQRTPEHRRLPAARAALVAALLLVSSAVTAQINGVLENPADWGSESGIHVVSGWHCTAQTIEIQFDQYDPIAAVAGSPRADTQTACGHINTGFALLWNWNILGPGQHTVVALADGIEFDRANLWVNTFGQEFMTGLDMEAEVTSMTLGKDIMLRWMDSKQGFSITEINDLDFTLEEIMAAIGGEWSGTWHSPLGTGILSMRFYETASGLPGLDQLQLQGTGCAQGGMALSYLDDISDPLIDVLMDDSSFVTFEFFVTESFTTLGGTFYFDDGNCAGTDGMFYMFK